MRPDASRSPQLDGLRAIAALFIVLTHLTSMSGINSGDALGPFFARLNVGVALFFVLSGYLLYRPWVAARLTGRPGPRLQRYAVRRATRILPAYWICLAVFAVVLPGWVEGATGGDWWVYFGLLQVYSQDWILGGLGVGWSLSTEVAFYVALPVLAYVGVRALGSRTRTDQVRLELLALATTALTALLVRELAYRAELTLTFDNTLIGKWPWFAVGMALAVASARWGADRATAPALVRSAAARPWLWWIGAAGVLVFASLESVLPGDVFWMKHRDLQVETILFALFAWLLVAPVVFGDAGRRWTPAGLLATRPAVWLGTVSYGIFLWHLPIAGESIERIGSVPLAWTVAVAITLVCATASWHLIEKPLMRATAGRGGARPDRERVGETLVLEPAP